MLPESFRIWEATRMGAAAWLVAGAIGYVLCECSTSCHSQITSVAPTA